jgi:hypothetical protein
MASSEPNLMPSWQPSMEASQFPSPSEPCQTTANKVLFNGFYYATAQFFDVELTATTGCDFDYNQWAQNIIAHFKAIEYYRIL